MPRTRSKSKEAHNKPVVEINRNVYEKLVQYAKAKGVSINRLVNDVLWDYIKFIDKTHVNGNSMKIHYRNTAGLSDEIDVVFDGVEKVEKIKNDTIEDIVRLAELIESIAESIDVEANDVRDAYIYPDGYEVMYTVSFDGARIMRIKHRTWLDDA